MNYDTFSFSFQKRNAQQLLNLLQYVKTSMQTISVSKTRTKVNAAKSGWKRSAKKNVDIVDNAYPWNKQVWHWLCQILLFDTLNSSKILYLLLILYLKLLQFSIDEISKTGFHFTRRTVPLGPPASGIPVGDGERLDSEHF